MKETIADVSSASPDEGLALEMSAIVSFTAFHYPHQHTVDTPVCLPPRRRSQPSSLKSWHYTKTITYNSFSKEDKGYFKGPASPIFRATLNSRQKTYRHGCKRQNKSSDLSITLLVHTN